LMPANFIKKVKEFMGLDYELEEDIGSSYQDTRAVTSRNNVVSFNAKKQSRVVIAEPSSYEQVQQIAENLKEHHTVIVNLENADAVVSQQIVDFLGGAVYALNGKMKKIGRGIFLFTPDNVDLLNCFPSSNDDKESKNISAFIKQKK
ncbi:cell division protein SepF, partial [Peptococcaceae bacterium]|nr:cell division protein SepF [Peptococcaceae bacterium]MCL0067928.1 cell division protein SepF [Peptococcaceae bacterium]